MLQIPGRMTPDQPAPLHGGSSIPASAPLQLDFAGLSDAGSVRTQNEDCIGQALPPTPDLARSHGWLFVLADGVGGQGNGEIASRMAVETLTSNFYVAAAGSSAADLLHRLAQLANRRIYEAGTASPRASSSMATTMVACLLRSDRATVAHVGDSRCYLIRRGQATALTHDHTLVQDQVRMGVLSSHEAASSEARHLLSRSLGSHTTVEIDIEEHPLLPGDVLLLSSDGLHGALSPAEMADAALQFADLKEAAQALVSLACTRDSSDNISVQLIRVNQLERTGMYRGRPYKLR